MNRDHPRVGGEKKGVRHWWALPRGSPPRWRGKATFSGRSDPGVGITPAWAGKSRIDKLEWIPVKDHPRVGGEKPVGYDLLQRPAGITPAWAGKRYCRQSPPRAGWDHPRVGGEKSNAACNSLSISGSPPRGRGKARRFSKSFSSARITPAWAGKSGQPRQPCQQPWDHPRVGGEKVFADSPSQKVQGSPPRGRGKEVKTRKSGDPTGITPAWAGKRGFLHNHRL